MLFAGMISIRLVLRISSLNEFQYSGAVAKPATVPLQAIKFHKSSHYISVRLSRLRKSLKQFLTEEGVVL